ncbi:hypothetical protein EYF80_029386 [Liparis tanakae]|uniref:Uncharacterized protein n=1 Tax=Liparis tanakae TaxID=230148 RepID=A0A4Z2H3G5_9TELE|nr:hypothetical protein EYF80_029386 [Liparis tanakae]
MGGGWERTCPPEEEGRSLAAEGLLALPRRGPRSSGCALSVCAFLGRLRRGGATETKPSVVYMAEISCSKARRLQTLRLPNFEQRRRDRSEPPEADLAAAALLSARTNAAARVGSE